MKVLSALLVLSASPALLAAVTPSVKSLAFTMRQGQPYPNNSTRYPANQQFSLSGSGAWVVTISGALSNQCGGPCLAVTPSSGTGPALLTVSFLGRGSESLPNGSYTGSLAIGSSSVGLSLSVLPRFAYDQFVYSPAYPNACLNTASMFPHADTCTLTDEVPGSPTLQQLGAGSSTLDQNFGTSLTRMTTPGYSNQYSTITAFSASAKYVMTADIYGWLTIFDRVSRSIAFSQVPGININFAAWDPSNDDKIWFLDGPSIKYRLLSRSETTVAANYSSAGSKRPAFTAISMGGTADITDDGWWVFSSGTYLCAVNLNNLSPGTQEAQTNCADLTPRNLSYLDFAQVTQVDSESKKRYVTVMAQPANHLYSVASGVLQYEGQIPTGSADVWASAHATIGQDSEGRQILFWQYAEIYGAKSFLASALLNKGQYMTRPIEEGGGLRFLYPSDPGNFTTDAHFGCTWRGVCVFTPYSGLNGVKANSIVSVASGDGCAVVTQAAHGFATGATVLIGGAISMDPLDGGAVPDMINGMATVTVTGPNAFTLDNRSCPGGYVANTANVVPNVRTAPDSPNRDEIVVARPGHEVRRIARHRAKPWDNGVNMLGYFNTPRTSLSRDGRYAAYSSNAGIPERSSIWIADTGITADVRIKQTSLTVTTSSASISYSVPASEGSASASVVVGPNPDLTANLVAQFPDGQTGTSRLITISGLQAKTTYYYRISTGRFSYTGTFTTLANSSRNGR